MFRRIHLLACTVMSFAAFAACSNGSSRNNQNHENAESAFVNVNVLTMQSKEILRDQTILVGDGRILALGPSDEIQVPRNALKIEGKGRFLMPGFG